MTSCQWLRKVSTIELRSLRSTGATSLRPRRKMTTTTPTTIPSRNGIRQPHVSSVSVVIVAVIVTANPEPIRKPRVVPQQATAPINPRRPTGARSTRKTIELIYSPPTESPWIARRSEEHTSELQSPDHLVCRLLLEKKKNTTTTRNTNAHFTLSSSITTLSSP